MKIINKTKFAIGTSLIAGLVTGCATSDNNPFGQEELSSGYMNQADSAKDEGLAKVKGVACGEGKCGGKMMKDVEKVKDGKCGAKMMKHVEKVEEGKCGAKMMKHVEKVEEGKCGGKMMKDVEKVKDGKCGAKKMSTDVEKAVEGKCGGNM